jgi:hypothetical protein
MSGASNACRALTAAGLAVVLLATPARAAPLSHSHGPDHSAQNGSVQERAGNGKYNNNQITINSPVFNRGIQHSDNGIVNGNIAVQGAICKRKKYRHCRIVQKISQVFPWP